MKNILIFLVLLLFIGGFVLAKPPSIYGYQNISVDNDTKRPVLFNITDITHTNITNETEYNRSAIRTRVAEKRRHPTTAYEPKQNKNSGPRIAFYGKLDRRNRKKYINYCS